MANSTTALPSEARLAGPRGAPLSRLALGLGLVIAFAPSLALHFSALWERPHYQFAPLAVVGAFVLAAREWRRPDFSPSSLEGSGWGWLFVALGWGFLAISLLSRTPWLAALAALITAAGVLFVLGGRRLFRRMLPAWILLAVTLPPPSFLDSEMIAVLQGITARGASRALDLIGVYHVRAGTTIDTPGQQFQIKDVCSGVNSLNSALAAVLFCGLWLKRGPAIILFLLVGTSCWVLAANSVRVALIALAGSWWGLDLGSGWQHETLGVLLFAAVLGMVWSTDCGRSSIASVVFRRRGVRKSATGSPGSSVVTGGICLVPPANRSSKLTWIMAAAFLGLGGVQLARLIEGAHPHATANTIFTSLSADTMPEQWKNWKRQNYGATQAGNLLGFGEQSRIWVYRTDDFLATVALDYPFDEWHDLPTCYRLQGWRPVSRQLVSMGESGTFLETHLERNIGEHGYLIFGLFDNHWQARPSPESATASALRVWKSRLIKLNAREASPSYQLQLFVESVAPLTPQQRAEATAFFQEATTGLARIAAARQVR